MNSVIATWGKLQGFIFQKLMATLQASGFWSLGWWAQIFAAVAVLFVGGVVCLGPLIFAAFRMFRSGDRPGLVGLVLIIVCAALGSVLMPLLMQVMQRVLDQHHGPVI